MQQSGESAVSGNQPHNPGPALGQRAAPVLAQQALPSGMPVMPAAQPTVLQGAFPARPNFVLPLTQPMAQFPAGMRGPPTGVPAQPPTLVQPYAHPQMGSAGMQPVWPMRPPVAAAVPARPNGAPVGQFVVGMPPPSMPMAGVDGQSPDDADSVAYSRSRRENAGKPTCQPSCPWPSHPGPSTRLSLAPSRRRHLWARPRDLRAGCGRRSHRRRAAASETMGGEGGSPTRLDSLTEPCAPPPP